MKVLLINKFHYIAGGSETYYFGLGDLLEKHGHEVIYFSMKDNRNRPCKQEKYFVENVDYNAPMSKVKMIKIGLKTLYSLEAKKKLEQLIKDEKPDIAHLNIFQSQLTASIVDVLYKHKIPMVYTMHELKSVCPCYTMLTHGEICERCMNGNYWNCIKHKCMKDSTAKSILAAMEAYVYRIRKTYQKLDIIITPSEFYKKKLEEANITNAKIIHMKNFLPEGTEYAEEISVGDYFLYFGRLSREKGLLTLLEAYKQANINKQLFIVGRGPLEETLREKIEDLRLSDSVKLIGFKSGQELKDVVRNSLCIVLPSEWYENGPYTIMEAQAAGKPCVVSDKGGLAELVTENYNGMKNISGNIESLSKKLCEINDLSDEMITAMGKHAVQFIKETSDSEKYYELMQKKYLELLEE